MVSSSVKTLILSFSLAAIATVANADPVTSHPLAINPTGCSALGAKRGVNITYDDVVNCYDSIPFNEAAAKSTIESLYTFFNDYYISRDMSTTPFLAKPLSSAPFDIVKKLKSIGSTRYTSDRKFHTDVLLAVNSLYDGHTAYERKFI